MTARKALLRATGGLLFIFILSTNIASCDSGSKGKKKGGGDAAKATPSPSASPSPSPSPDGGDPGDDDPVPSPSPSPSGTAWKRGAGLAGCESQGKVWIAVGAGNSAECGESLAKFCCQKAELVNRFGASFSTLATKIDEKVASGLKLYGCSTNGTDKTTLHFLKATPTLVSYEYLVLSKPSEVGVPDASCPRETEQSLGLDKVGVGTNTGTGTQTSTSTNTSTDED